MADAEIKARMEAGLDKQLVEILENGMPVTDKDGNAVLDRDGNLMRMPPTAAFLNVARQRIKEMIDGDADKSAVQKAIEALSRGRSAVGSLPPDDDVDPAAR